MHNILNFLAKKQNKNKNKKFWQSLDAILQEVSVAETIV